MSQSSSPLVPTSSSSTAATSTTPATTPTTTASTGTFISLPVVGLIAAGAFVAGLAVAQFLPPWVEPKKTKKKVEKDEDA
jgi:hypothetical protein